MRCDCAGCEEMRLLITTAYSNRHYRDRISIISLGSKSGWVRLPGGNPVWSEPWSKGIAMRLEQLLLANPVGLERGESGERDFEATKYAFVIV